MEFDDLNFNVNFDDKPAPNKPDAKFFADKNSATPAGPQPFNPNQNQPAQKNTQAPPPFTQQAPVQQSQFQSNANLNKKGE